MMMKSAEAWINTLKLEPHPEGGYFRQTDQSAIEYHIDRKGLPLYTNINFLLMKDNPSHFHQLTSDELWFFHDGNPLTVHSIYPDGRYEAVVLGLGEGQKLNHTVPSGTIFGSTVEEGYALVSCTVVPGFDFENFRLFSQDELLKLYPEHESVIKRLAYK